MRKALTMLGAIAALAIGSLFAAAPANAQAALQTISNGGVTCKQYAAAGGSQPYFPSTFWDCIDTANPPTSGEKLVGSQARNLPAAMKTTLANVEAMIFKNAAEFAAFTGTAAPASKYMAWTANSGPGALSGKRIAAVFSEASLWSPNVAPTNTIATRDISSAYPVNILQALGRHYDQLTGNAAHKSTSGSPFYTLVHVYDKYWINEETSTTVWGSTIAGLYPGSDPWTILGTLYGNSAQDIYAFQFASDFGSTWSHLQQFINARLENTGSFRSQQLFAHAPVLTYAHINAVFCVEYTTTGYAAPADKIWDCVHPYNYTAGEHQAGASVGAMPASLRALLTGTKLYTFFDYTHFNQFVQPTPLVPQIGTSGATKNSTKQSGAFATVWKDASTPIIIDQYYRGTLVHEVGHLLDEQFASYAPGKLTYSAGTAAGSWGALLAADVTQFNALSCMTAINDNFICTDASYSGLSNYNRFLKSMGLYGKSADYIAGEMFSYMMQKKSGQTTYTYLQNVENVFWTLGTPNMKTKMDAIWTNGHP